MGARCGLAGDGDSSGVAVGDGVGVFEGDAGASDGSGDGLVFFFRCGDVAGEGAGEVFFFVDRDGVGDSSSVVVGTSFFFFDRAADGVGDSLSSAGDDFLDGLGVGVGDFFFVAEVLFFFRGFGVGVGVENIFLIVSPSDCSARTGATNENKIATRMKKRSGMLTVGRGETAISY